MMNKIFITGTDTDAGKTLVATTLLYKAQAQGLSCFGLKPIAAGCEWSYVEQEQEQEQGQWHNDDALFLQAASQPAQSYSVHNPFAFPQAIAPHIAATLNDQTLSVKSVLDACEVGLQQDVDFHLIEGAGGWLVPLNDNETLADLAQQLANKQGYKMVLVVGMKLGCINHALLTQQLILASGLELVGWVANHIDPEMSEQDANFAYLQGHIKAPCLGRIPYSPNIAAKDLIHHIEIPR
ncbi:dethiobiotin synthase [Oleispira antarctica]|uniref:ATP-dependent dethiobiotin synthetase BioD n=1 Tax=Oleispira antarctica TaxID=188908 RepID=A0A1Y5I005_OLEAN|nr:dethiobiotin synthase [Oleispira antarctica]